jgi:hypothetical protein
MSINLYLKVSVVELVKFLIQIVFDASLFKNNGNLSQMCYPSVLNIIFEYFVLNKNFPHQSIAMIYYKICVLLKKHAKHVCVISK